jgi:vacuolar-type H+-ATPase subunit E/Vma4
MSLEKIESAVLAKARADADSIISAAREKGEQELARFIEEAALDVQNAVQNAEIAATRETNRQLSIARQEGRMSVLTAKNKLVDIVMSHAAEALRNLNDKEYSEIIERWLVNLSPDIGGTISISSRDEKLFNSRFLDKVNTSRPASGKFTNIETNPRMDRGFMIIGGSFTADFTISVLIEKVRESSIGDLAKELFEP